MTIQRNILRCVDKILRYLPATWLPGPISDENEKLSPLLQLLLVLKRKSGAPVLCEGSANAGRLQYRNDVLPLAAKYNVSAIQDFSIPVAGRGISVRHYTPFAHQDAAAVLVYLHGGGYVIGDLDTHDDICRLISLQAGVQVLSVDYRLAPEHPYPAGLEDAEAVVKWVQNNSARFSIEKHAVLVGGDSAGATLAAATANLLADTEHAVLAQLLIYPGADRSSHWASYDLFGEHYFLNTADRDWFYAHYIQHCDRLAREPAISPLLYPFCATATPGVIVTAGFDVLRDEGRAYAKKLAAMQSDIHYLHFGRLTHGFVNLVGVHKESEKASITFSNLLGQMVENRAAGT